MEPAECRREPVVPHNEFQRGFRGMFCAALLLALNVSTFGQETAAILRSGFEVWTDGANRPAQRVEAEIIVNFYDPEWRVLWVQDGESAAYLNSGDRPLPFQSGDLVRVEGWTAAGKAEIDWSKSEVTVLQEKAWLPAVDFNASGQLPSVPVYVEIEGYLHSFKRNDAQHVEYTFRTPHGEFRTFLRTKGAERIETWSNVAVRVRGVISYARDPSGNIRHRTFWVADSSQIRPKHAPNDDPAFDSPLTTIAELNAHKGATVRIRGKVRRFVPGKTLEIWDATAQASAQVWQTELLESGEWVEVAGQVSEKSGKIFIQNGLFRRMAKLNETEGPDELRLVAEVRDLTDEEAATGRPVRIAGVVTW